MARSQLNWCGSVGGLVVLLGLFAPCGPADAQLAHRPRQEPREQEALVLPIAPAPSPAPLLPRLSLSQLTELASRNHPELAAAQARVLAAQGRLIQAGLYPNPVIGARTDEWGPHNPGHPGAVFGQEFVTAGKLRLARAAASFGIQSADWQTTTRWFDVVTRVRLAYFDLLVAQRDVEVLTRISGLAKRSLEAANILYKAGAKEGGRIDVLRAQVELDQTQNRLIAAKVRLDAGWRILTAAVGVVELPRGFLAGALETPAPPLDWHALVEEMLQRSSEIQEAEANLAEAEQMWQLARARRFPNVTVNVQPFYSIEERDPRVELVVTAPLPLFDRNQGNIFAAQAEVARHSAVVKQTELRLIERLAGAFQRYQAARQQVENYSKKGGILANAAESLRLVQIGYEKSDPRNNYTALLQAQQVLFQAELSYVQLLGEQWRALAEITALVQERELLGFAGPGGGNVCPVGR